MRGELADWQVKKFSNLFDLFDVDGDGTVDEQEIDGCMERLLVETGWPESSRVSSHVTARWKIFLRSLFVDTPILTEQKWIDFLSRAVKRDRQAREQEANHRGHFEEVAQLLFLLLDRNRDSKIDFQEFLLFFYAVGQGDREAEQSFEKLDIDGDGLLDKQEMEEMALGFFHQAQAGSHSDWLFGPPPTV